MSELLRALEKFEPKIKKRYFALVKNEKILEIGNVKKDNTIELSPKQFKKLLDVGIENFLWKENKIVRVVKEKNLVIEPELKINKEQGYKLLGNNPFWPLSFEEKQENLYTWQIKSE